MLGKAYDINASWNTKISSLSLDCDICSCLVSQRMFWCIKSASFNIKRISINLIRKWQKGHSRISCTSPAKSTNDTLMCIVLNASRWFDIKKANYLVVTFSCVCVLHITLLDQIDILNKRQYLILGCFGVCPTVKCDKISKNEPSYKVFKELMNI